MTFVIKCIRNIIVQNKTSDAVVCLIHFDACWELPGGGGGNHLNPNRVKNVAPILVKLFPLLAFVDTFEHTTSITKVFADFGW